MEVEIDDAKSNIIEDKSNSHATHDQNWKRNSIPFRAAVKDAQQSGIPHKLALITYKRYHLQNSKLLLCNVCGQLLWDFQIANQPPPSLQAKSAKDGYQLFKCSGMSQTSSFDSGHHFISSHFQVCGFLAHKSCVHDTPKSCRSSTTMLLWTHEGLAESGTKFQLLNTRVISISSKFLIT